jgi:quercetin dioxygenase-like cupin family protein
MEETCMFQQHSESGYEQASEGVQRKTLVYGERTLAVEFRMEKGQSLPAHSHPHEQTGYLASGRIRMSIADEMFEIGPGDSWCILGDVEHQVTVLEDSVAIEVFSPVREDYLPT